MAVVSRIARINITGATGNRQWTATAATQDTAAGSSVVITVAQTSAGITPPGTPNTTREMRVVNESGTTVRSYTWTEGAASTDFTFFFTVDGQSGSSPRAGTYEIVLLVTKTNGGPTATYDVESDGSPNTPPTLFTTELDRGWIRSTTTLTVTASNISLGGGKTEPAQYQDNLYHRSVMAAAPTIAKSLTAVFTGTSKSNTSSSSTSATKDVTFSGTSLTTGRVNEGVPAADATYTATIATPANATLTGQPWTVFTTINTDTLNIDPRLTATHLMQLDDNSYGTPPLSKQNADTERPSTSIAYFGTHIRAARGIISGDTISEGITGITADFTLTSAVNGAVVSRTASTTTEGGEAGWTSGFMQWTSPLPGGTWDKAVDITSPSDIDAASYLLNSTEAYTLIASRNPFITMAVDAGHSDSADNDRHIHTGDSIEIATWMVHTKQGESRLIAFDEAGVTPEVNIARSTGSGVVNWDGANFVSVDGTPDSLEWLAMTKDADGFRWIYTATTDSTWGDVVITCRGQYLAVQYDANTPKELVGRFNRHDDPFTPLLLWVPITDRGNHFIPGDTVIVSFSLFAADGTTAPAFDADPDLVILRINAALGLEYLDAALAWQTFVDLPSSYAFPMVGGSVTLTDTSGFDESDLLLVATAEVNGEPVGRVKEIEVVAGFASHSEEIDSGPECVETIEELPLNSSPSTAGHLIYEHGGVTYRVSLSDVRG